MDLHGRVQLVADLDRLVVHELLVDLDDLHGLHADVDHAEEVLLNQQREDRHEGQRRDQGVVAELGGGGFVEGGGVDRILTALANWRTCSRPTTKTSGYLWTIPRMSAFRAMSYANFAVATARPKIFFPPVVAEIAMVTDFDSASTDFTRPLNTSSAPTAVVGHRDHRGEADVVLGDRGRVADPSGDEATAQAHGQHAVGDRGVQTDLLGDLVVPVDGVQIPGDAGVVDQILRVSGMICSGSWSPTLTEPNSRSAI